MSAPDWVIVGAGFTGAVVAERIASGLGQDVLVIDRRTHIAGNAYDEPHESGCLIHRYGPHIFHTNSKPVWDYLSRFTAWRPYYHRVLGMVDGCAVPIPFNLNSVRALFPPRMADRLSEALISRYGFGKKVPILKLRQEADPDLRFLGTYIFQKVFEGYTLKQWSLRPDQLDPSVTARVPVHVSRDDRYFQDTYQAMPEEGYTALFRRLLDHPRISVRLGVDWKSLSAAMPHARIVYTGAIDEFFDYEYGALPYRSLRFEPMAVAPHRGLPVGTMNFPNEFDFTRITDQRHLSGTPDGQPVLIHEYPEAHMPGVNERYYPVPTEASTALLQPYLKRAEELKGRVFFAGRLGDYAYYNMDQACARALTLFHKQIAAALPMAAE
ncbi:UDP-galactopyranose mutase [Aquabacter sp. CN5-332]|uniref:UDP-galactopyranose mutase n=1 Tax=Aquabacter sp. CN5-332 TaxID=3156608 RepID=UPI0032B58F76